MGENDKMINVLILANEICCKTNKNHFYFCCKQEKLCVMNYEHPVLSGASIVPTIRIFNRFSSLLENYQAKKKTRRPASKSLKYL